MTPGLVPLINAFGSIDAESEAQLGEFFLRTEAYQRIEDQQHLVVVGRKGTGKTAIYKTLLGRQEDVGNVYVAGLEFARYPWATHQEVKDTSATPVERYSASWRFLILVELAKRILMDDDEHDILEDRAIKAARTLRKFIRKNWGQVDFKVRDVFTRGTYSFHFEPTVLGNKLGGLKVDDVPRERLATFLDEVNEHLQALLADICIPENWYYILFDDLDRGYDPEDPEYTHRLVGLLLASRDVYLWARSKDLLIAPITFVRSDIYDGLSFPDKNKITENLVETLTWTDNESGEDSLKSLIDQRIRVITNFSGDDPWSGAFDVDERMRGTQAKFKHMAARTYLRPRDMIQFANECLREAKLAGRDRIANKDISGARPAYSEYLMRELDDEINEVAEKWKRYTDVLRQIHTVHFKRSEFDAAFKALKLIRLGRSADDVLELLYRFSIIGFAKRGGGGYGGSSTCFYYRTSANFDPTATSFSVHLGLKDALELVESQDRKR
jgi:hypothetical protein